MAQCAICKSAAEEIDRGFFDGVGFDCRRHGRFRVTGTVIKLRNRIVDAPGMGECPDGRRARG